MQRHLPVCVTSSASTSSCTPWYYLLEYGGRSGSRTLPGGLANPPLSYKHLPNGSPPRTRTGRYRTLEAWVVSITSGLEMEVHRGVEPRVATLGPWA